MLQPERTINIATQSRYRKISSGRTKKTPQEEHVYWSCICAQRWLFFCMYSLHLLSEEPRLSSVCDNLIHLGQSTPFSRFLVKDIMFINFITIMINHSQNL